MITPVEAASQFVAQAAVLETLLSVTQDQATWKPSEKSWSLLEVTNHLWDEEKEDFKKRLDLLLHAPGQEWPSIDPEGWVKGREYAARDQAESLHGFLNERQASVNWLRALSVDDDAWNNKYEHPALGTILAGDMLASWLSHDLLHTRQILKLHQFYSDEQLKPFSRDYAGGKW